MADLKFIGVNFPSGPKHRQADPVTDRLLINTLGPSGGSGGPLVVAPVSAVTGTDLVLSVGTGVSTVLTINGDGTASFTRPWTNGTDRSWANALTLDPSTAPSFGSDGSVQIVIGSGLSPAAGSGTDGANNPSAGSLMLQTDGTAWLKTGAGATAWTQLATASGSSLQTSYDAAPNPDITQDASGGILISRGTSGEEYVLGLTGTSLLSTGRAVLETSLVGVSVGSALGVFSGSSNPEAAMFVDRGAGTQYLEIFSSTGDSYLKVSEGGSTRFEVSKAGGSTVPLLRIAPEANGSNPNQWVALLSYGDNASELQSTGVYLSETSPEGVITAPPGSTCHVRYPSSNDNDGIWVKKSGAGNTGWLQALTEIGNPDPRTAPFFDDFTGSGIDWFVNVSNDGKANLSPTGTPLGFPSFGIALLRADVTASSKATITCKNTGFVLGAASPITMTVSYAGPFDGVGAYSDDECQWYIAIGDETGANTVALFAIWSGGTRSYALATIVGGVLTTEAITMPAITLYATVRLTISETGTTVEVAPDGGAFSTVLTGANAPAQVVYSSVIQVAKDTGVGDRTLAIDYVLVDGSRAAMDSGVTIPTESDFATTDVLAFLAANTSDVDFNGVSLLSVADPATAQGVATKSSSEAAATAAAQSFANINAALNTANADVSVNNQKIINVGTPTLPADATDKDYVDTGDSTTLASANGTAGALATAAAQNEVNLRTAAAALTAPFAILYDGVVATPAVSFTADTGTGVWRPGAGILGVAGAGLEVVRFQAPGGTDPQTLFASGTATKPSISFAASTTMGFYYGGAGTVMNLALDTGPAMAFRRITGTQFGILYEGATAGGMGVGSNVNGSYAFLFSRISNQATPASVIGQYSSVPFTGGAGINQIGLQINHILNQTSTSSFTNIDINRTETAVGSGNQYIIDAKAGVAGTTRVFSVTNKGRVAAASVASATVSVTLPAGSSNNYSGLDPNGFARLNGDAAGSTITGILAPSPAYAYRLVLTNVSANPITINHQDASSSAANRIQTFTGFATVLSQNEVMVLEYDPTSAFWRETTTVNDADMWEELLGPSKQWIPFFRDSFGLGINAWTTVAVNGGSVTPTTTGGMPAVRVYCGVTNAAGYANIHPYFNNVTASIYSRYYQECLCVLDVRPSVAVSTGDDFGAAVCYIGTTTAGVPVGDSLGFRAISSSGNWQATKWIGGTPTDIDTGIATDLLLHRFRIEHIVGTSVTWYIDGVQVAQITSSFPTISAAYLYPSLVYGISFNSLTTRAVRTAFAHAAGKLATTRN